MQKNGDKELISVCVRFRETWSGMSDFGISPQWESTRFSPVVDTVSNAGLQSSTPLYLLAMAIAASGSTTQEA